MKKPKQGPGSTVNISDSTFIGGGPHHDVSLAMAKAFLANAQGLTELAIALQGREALMHIGPLDEHHHHYHSEEEETNE